MIVLLTLSLFIQLSACVLISSKNISFIIFTQSNDFHQQEAENLKIYIINQFKELKQDDPIILLTHKDFAHAGSWTIFPLLLHLSNLNLPNLAWLFFLEDNTVINVKRVIKEIGKYDYNEKLWIGNELYDEDATIIHHFAFHQHPNIFKYPNIASGFAISIALFKGLAHRLKTNVRLPDFNIDNSHEFAIFVWDEGKGQTLTHEPTFCIENASHCSTYVKLYTIQNTAVPNEDIFFLVKTCEKFHNDRIPVIKETWGKRSNQIIYFSNVEDKWIPTINLGVPNTERGHCAKTMAILKYIHKEVEESRIALNWVVVVDDDTIISVPRLQRLLSRYNHTQDVALGERYGYNVAYTLNRGYNYITGGGGMVFSMSVVNKIIKRCQCPTPDSPDDMIIGACLATLNIEITHSPAFHQARPVDYSTKYLQNEKPVSFHKHWMIDPIKVYKEWFDILKTPDTSINNIHYEL